MVTCPGCGEDNPPKFRLCGYCGTALAAQPPAPPALPSHEVRKTVTIVFCDLKGSTALTEVLDPEAMREVTDRYFTAMAAEITKHGGKIEKYIGDAIMAVFGLPRAHEDDALRAVRAAAGMRDALRGVNAELTGRYGVALANRTGVNTGSVVANDDPGVDQKLATGDAVNVAARLEQAAPENEIYLGATTYGLVRDAVEVETVEPLELKGKSQRVPAFRLVSIRGLDGNVRRQDTPIVGRDAELTALEAQLQEAIAQRAPRLATIVGDAGVGKSRLVHEVLERAAPRARVLRGRCLPYGDGITFWPLVGMLTQAAGILADDPPEVARARVLALVDDAEVAERLASAVGLSAAPFPLLDLYWAARKFLAGLAEERPVVVLLDDIHWAEPAFLDLIEHILGTAGGSPILMLATARHDLIEERPDWGDRPGSIRLVLRPLSNNAAARVVTNLLGSAGLSADVVERIVVAAEGNPLFVEQMLSMLIDTGALRLENGAWVRAERYGDIAVPPTIQALLEARLDRLGREERAAVDPASVIGLEFAQLAVQALAPAALRVGIERHLSALAHKQFIRPSTSPGQTEARFRFDHHLVRETVYNGLLKRARATMHTDFVRWADGINAERDRGLEFEEILGYHLEQAHRYLSELGTKNEQVVAIGVDAAARLGRAGRRAFARSDMAAAANLVQRASALLPAKHPDRLALLPLLAEAMMERGDFAAAREVLGEAASAADSIGDTRLQMGARLVRMLVRLYSAEPGEWSSQALRVARESLPALESLQAHNELATAWRLIAIIHGVAGRYAEVVNASEQVLTYARLGGNDRLVSRTRMGLATSALLGPTPVREAIEQCDRLVADGLSDRQVESSILCTLAQLRAMNGEFDEARTLVRRGRAVLRDLGQGVRAASTSIALARVELLAGDLEGAEREVQADCDFLARIGETYFLSTVAGFLARILRERGLDDDAFAASKIAEAAAAVDDVDAQILWRSVRAPILARQGDIAGAEALARSALELALQTEDPVCRADALSELAIVLSVANRADEAWQHATEAFNLYSAKGDIVSAARVTKWLGEMTGLREAPH